MIRIPGFEGGQNGDLHQATLGTNHPCSAECIKCGRPELESAASKIILSLVFINLENICLAHIYFNVQCKKCLGSLSRSLVTLL